MVSQFVRTIRTASCSVSVQVVAKDRGQFVEIDHGGSAHTDAELDLLLELAGARLHPRQGTLDPGPLPQIQAHTEDAADWTTGQADADLQPVTARPRLAAGGERVVATAALLPWNVLAEAFAQLGFDTVGGEVFKLLVLARIIEPTTKAHTIRILEKISVDTPSMRTVLRCLQRRNKQDYRGLLAKACLAHSVPTTGSSAMVLYDVTALHLEDEDALRKVGIPVLDAFQAHHGVADIVVVADADNQTQGTTPHPGPRHTARSPKPPRKTPPRRSLSRLARVRGWQTPQAEQKPLLTPSRSAQGLLACRELRPVQGPWWLSAPPPEWPLPE